MHSLTKDMGSLAMHNWVCVAVIVKCLSAKGVGSPLLADAQATASRC